MGLAAIDSYSEVARPDVQAKEYTAILDKIGAEGQDPMLG